MALISVSRMCLACLLLATLVTQATAGWFYGIAYTPYRVFGSCPSDADIENDVQILLRHTNRVRLYSTECKNVNRILLKHSSEGNLQILFGVWLDNRATDQQEIDYLIEALVEFPQAKISGIAVGNEVLYRNTMHKHDLLAKVAEVRNKVRGLGDYNGNLSLKTAPVYAVEMFPDPDVAQASDALGLNIHPFYRPDLQDASDPEIMSDRILEAAKQQIDLYRNMAPNKPIIVTEIGWPTSSSSRDLHRGDTQVALRFMQKFTDFCVESGVQYYWFELFDSTWKKGIYPVDEPTMSEFNFGMYYQDRHTIKSVPGHNRKLMS